uniref:Immunoglobulin V-set domain-containing protein n=1 Tax=Peromyscus maniculatus bairdii TaxID=230844 RepID=A0A8C8UH11_PERMB
LSPHCTCYFLFALCVFLQTDLTDAGITQTPRYWITQTGRKMTLECSQDMNHYWMFWYRQDAGQGLKLLHYSGSVGSTDKGDVPEGYSLFFDDNSELNASTLVLKVSALYVCTSILTSLKNPPVFCA